MALTGLDIYKLLPKTNCKECGYATCLAFAMALAQKKASLDKCPRVTEQAKAALESASQPPVKLVTIGTGDKSLEMGNETVMYRHEQKFFHPAGIGFLVEDTLSESELAEKVSKINGLSFERVGQTISVNLICLKDSSNNKDAFVKAAGRITSSTNLNIALYTPNAETLAEALKVCRDRRPLIICDNAVVDGFIKLAKENGVPLAVTCAGPEEAAQITDKAKQSGVEEIVINLKDKNMADTIQDFTFIRRTALKKNLRSLGFPLMAFTNTSEPHAELAEAISYVMKYASLVIMKTTEKEFVLPLLVSRQDVYSDPQKPVQEETKIYEIGRVGKNSPVLVTTNFSITYFTVAGEVEASKVPSYILCCDSEGMSVLTAWAAEKFTAEKIDEAVKKFGLTDIVAHKKLIIPGYVAVMSGKLEELMPGWGISVGPREASGIPNYLRNWKA